MPPKLAAQLNQNSPEFLDALKTESLRRAENFLTGLRTYRHHTATRTAPDAPVVWQQGTTQLRDYNQAAPDAPPVLVVPSLINRFHILDLDTRHSFLRFLAAQGFRPMLVDWNAPADDENRFTLDDYITQRLAPILAFIHQPAHLIGYCMGGLLALALAARQPQNITSLTLLATPWDFHAPDKTASQNLAALTENWLAVAPHAPVPVDIVQSLFWLTQPFQAAQKFARFADNDPTSAEAHLFVLVEDWLNDGVALAPHVARQAAQDWFNHNLTATHQWRMGGHTINPTALNIPSLIVAPQKDKLVPPAQSLPLAQQLRHSMTLQPPTGHIGMMAGTSALSVWEKTASFLKAWR